jgi:predicted MFS family arabinose efflux permease
MGVMMGPMIAGALGSAKPNLPFVWGGIIFFVMAGMVWLVRDRMEVARPSQDGVDSWKEVAHDKLFLVFVFLCILYWINFQQLNVSLPVQMVKAGGNDAFVSLLLTASGLFGVGWMLVLKKQFEAKHPLDLVKIGILVTGCALSLVPCFKNIWWILVCTLMFMLGETLFFPGSKIATAEFSRNRNTGIYFGVWEISWGVGAGLGNYIGTLLTERQESGLVWVVYGVLGVAGFAMVDALKKKMDRKPERNGVLKDDPLSVKGTSGQSSTPHTKSISPSTKGNCG